jgi:beta-mannosidase
MARKFYAPILVSGLENTKDGTIDIFVTNDRLENHHGRLTWNITDLDGNSLLKESMDLEIPARKSQKVKTLRLQDQIQKLGANGFLTWLKLEVDGKTVSENMVSFVLPKELKLSDPKLATVVEEASGGFAVTIKSEKPALWTWLGLENADAKFSDNFLHVTPDAAGTILVSPVQKMDRDAFANALRIRSLFDTYLTV